MKNLTLIMTALVASVVLTACGGASSPSATSNTDTTATPTPAAPTPTTNNPVPVEDDAGELIIDNGRGTTNNQDTERPDKNTFH